MFVNEAWSISKTIIPSDSNKRIHSGIIQTFHYYNDVTKKLESRDIAREFRNIT